MSATKLIIASVFALIACLTPIVSGTAAAAPFDAAQEAAISAANARLNQIGNLQGTFVQTGPNGEHSEGKVYIQRPGKMRFEYDKPHPMLIVADGRWVAVEDRKAKTTEQYPLKLTPLQLILDANVDLRTRANIVSVDAGPDATIIVLEDKDGKVPGRLALLFSSADFALQQWTVTDAQGLDTSVALYDLIEGKKAPAKLFFINQNIYPDQAGGNGR